MNELEITKPFKLHPLGDESENSTMWMFPILSRICMVVQSTGLELG